MDTMPGLQAQCQGYRHNDRATNTDTMPVIDTYTYAISGPQSWTQCQGYRHNARATDTDTVPARVTNTDTISGLQLWTQC